MPHYRQDRNFHERPDQAVFLYGFKKPNSMTWDNYREACYQDLKNKYKVYIVKFDIGVNNEFAYLHLKTREMAEKLKNYKNYTDPNSGEQMSRLRLCSSNVVVYPYMKDRNQMLALQQQASETYQNMPVSRPDSRASTRTSTRTEWSDFDYNSSYASDANTDNEGEFPSFSRSRQATGNSVSSFVADQPVNLDDGQTSSRPRTPDMDRQETVKPYETQETVKLETQETLKAQDNAILHSSGLILPASESIAEIGDFNSIPINTMPPIGSDQPLYYQQDFEPKSTSRSRAESVADSFFDGTISRGEETEAAFQKELKHHMPEVFWTLQDKDQKIAQLRELYYIGKDTYLRAQIDYSDSLCTALKEMNQANLVHQQRQEQMAQQMATNQAFLAQQQATLAQLNAQMHGTSDPNLIAALQLVQQTYRASQNPQGSFGQNNLNLNACNVNQNLGLNNQLLQQSQIQNQMAYNNLGLNQQSVAQVPQSFGDGNVQGGVQGQGQSQVDQLAGQVNSLNLAAAGNLADNFGASQ